MFKLTPGDDHLFFEGEWLANFLRGLPIRSSEFGPQFDIVFTSNERRGEKRKKEENKKDWLKMPKTLLQ